MSNSCNPGAAARQASLSVGFSRQEFWSGLPFLSPGDLPDTGIEPRSPTLQMDSLPTEHKGSPRILEWVSTPSLADLPDPGIELGSPALQADSLPAEL